MDKSAEVAIVGGGVMGSAIAYFLAADPAFQGRIVVVERDPTYAACATTRSWGGIRQQFSTPENVLMSLYGADFVRRAGDLLAVEGEAPDLGFKEQGYLFLASETGLPILERNVSLQQDLGARNVLLTPKEIGARFPWMALDGLAGGALGLANEGWIDPAGLLQGFRRKARALGARYLQDEVTAIRREGARVTGLTLSDGGELSCGLLVNAAGPQAGQVAALAGADLPVEPRKRMTFVFDCRATLGDGPGSLPLVIDPSGVAFRPESGQYLGIVSPPEEADGPADDLELDYTPFEEVIWPVLAARVPAFESIKLTRAWAGHYDYNRFDQNAILGPHPEIAGLYFCNGFSGHGIQQSPAAGRALAELIRHGRYQTLDLSALGYARIAEGRPIKEVNVV